MPPKISAKELQNTKFDEKRKELKSAQEAKLSDQKHYIKQNKKIVKQQEQNVQNANK